MSPPGKKIGVTTNESVVNASRVPPISSTAWSSIFSNVEFLKRLTKTFSISSADSFPPLPCPSTICGCSKIGQRTRPKRPQLYARLFALVRPAFDHFGSLPAECCFEGARLQPCRNRSPSIRLCRRGTPCRSSPIPQRHQIRILQMPPVRVVRRARALGRHHGRTQRMLRRALGPERRTIMRLLDPLQNLPAMQTAGSIVSIASTLEQLLPRRTPGTPRAAGSRSAESSPRPATCGRITSKHLRDQFLRRAICRPARAPANTGSPPPRALLPAAAPAISTPSRMSSGSKPVTTIGT